MKVVYMWTDSHTVLHWLNRRGAYKQLVECRVRETEKLYCGLQRRYCPTDQNPAEIGTRWWKGPNWLVEERLPEQPVLAKSKKVSEEEIKNLLSVNERSTDEGLKNLVKLKKFSSKIGLFGLQQGYITLSITADQRINSHQNS